MADDKVTIRVHQDAHKKAKDRKEDAGQTWDEYVADENRGSPDPGEVARELMEVLDLSREVDYERLGEVVAKELEKRLR